MLRSLLVLCLVCIASPALAQEYQSKELADAARDWRQQLIASTPASKKQPGLIAGLRRTAETDYQAKRYAAAIDELMRAIANGADDGLVFTRLPAIVERAEELRRLVAFRVTKVEIQAEAEWGRACLRFNEPIGTKDISHASFVRSEPALEGIVTGRGDTLCLDGMKHG